MPATADAGTLTTRVGFQAAEVIPAPPAEVKAVLLVVSVCAAAALAWPGVTVAVPLVAVAAPDQ